MKLFQCVHPPWHPNSPLPLHTADSYGNFKVNWQQLRQGAAIITHQIDPSSTKLWWILNSSFHSNTISFWLN